MAYESFREQFAAAHERFETAMTAAARAHFDGIVLVAEVLERVERRQTKLAESVDELKRLMLEQGAQIREQSDQIRDLRTRLDRDQ